LYRHAYVYFSIALLVAVVGFFPSYFSRLRTTDAVHHFHGVLASMWMFGLITQSWLMSQGKTALHRTLGKLSLLIAPLFILSGLLVVHVMLSSNDDFSKAFGVRLAFIDLTTMLYFGVAYTLAIRHRKSMQLHARYMASTALLVFPPALARLLGNFVPGIESFEAALHCSYFICEAIVAVLLFDDFRTGRVRAPYPILLLVFALQQASFLVSPSPSWWNAVTLWIGRL
jgi:hypothetical protein